MFGSGAIKACSVVPHSAQPLRSASSGLRTTWLTCTLAVLVTREISFRDLRPLELGLDARSGGLSVPTSRIISRFILFYYRIYHFLFALMLFARCDKTERKPKGKRI